MTEHPITRKTLLGGVGAGVLGVTLAGCGGSSAKLPDESAATNAASSTPSSSGNPGSVSAKVPGPPSAGGTRGGRVINVFDEEGNSYDPAIGYSTTGWEAISELLFAALYAYGADGSPEPNAAAAMPKITHAGKRYTIPLRTDVTFHNGRKVVADDYIYAWERVLTPKLQSWASSYIYTIKGAKAMAAGKAKHLSGVRALDDHTLEVTLTQPDVTFLYALTQPFMAPVPREVVEKWGDRFSTHVIGNGPFKLASYDSQGQKMVFTRYDGYFWKGLPYLDEVEYRWGVDQGVQLLELRRGDVDILGYGLNPQSLTKVNASPALKKFEFTQPLFASRWINLDKTRVPALKIRAVRQALNWATDREQLHRVMGDEATAWGAPFPIDLLGDARTFKPYTYDLDKAKALMKQAGSPKVELTFWVTIAPEPAIGQLLQQQWKAIGVDVKLKQASTDAVNDLILKNKTDAWVSSYYAIYPTAIDVISQYWETGGAANDTDYSSPLVDRLTAKARRTPDKAKRDALLAQVEQTIGDDAAGVFIGNINWIMARDPALENFHYSGVYGTYYDRLWVKA